MKKPQCIGRLVRVSDGKLKTVRRVYASKETDAEFVRRYCRIRGVVPKTVIYTMGKPHVDLPARVR